MDKSHASWSCSHSLNIHPSIHTHTNTHTRVESTAAPAMWRGGFFTQRDMEKWKVHKHTRAPPQLFKWLFVSWIHFFTSPPPVLLLLLLHSTCPFISFSRNDRTEIKCLPFFKSPTIAYFSFPNCRRRERSRDDERVGLWVNFVESAS